MLSERVPDKVFAVGRIRKGGSDYGGIGRHACGNPLHSSDGAVDQPQAGNPVWKPAGRQPYGRRYWRYSDERHSERACWCASFQDDAARHTPLDNVLPRPVCSAAGWRKPGCDTGRGRRTFEFPLRRSAGPRYGAGARSRR